MSSLRPRVDPALVEKVRQEELAKQRQMAEQAAEAGGFGGFAGSATGSMLPPVGTSSLAGSMLGGSAGGAQGQSAAEGEPIITPADRQSVDSLVASTPLALDSSPSASGKPPEVLSYAGGYGASTVPPPPPGGAGAPGGALVPPPPAVSLATQAQMAPYGGLPPMDPYANPYMNPYAQQQQQAAAVAPQRPALFGSGGRSGSESGEESGSPAKSKKQASFVPITPTGMEPRSPYKQRDDLKVLWKGALALSPLQRLISRDEGIAQQINKIDVGLPAETTRGTFSVAQRQIDAVFKPVPLDKRVAAPVKKLESDLCQSYYRYLYAFNKFALAQQTVAARKQEVDVAGSAAEQQRAAADLAQAQSEAEAAREDMRAAQYELASVAGAQAARTIIGRVSGVAPSLESLAQAESTSAPAAASASTDRVGSAAGGLLGSVGSIFGFGKKDATAGGAAEKAKEGKAEAKKDKDKGKGKKGGDKPGDLAPAPASTATVAAKAAAPEAEAAPAPDAPIAFELKNVNITARKSILKVAVRNNGGDSFSFDPEAIAVSEGNRQLSEASIRADFDTTMVQPHQEVTGTITIFGRPWNDRLSVALSASGKSIPLRR